MQWLQEKLRREIEGGLEGEVYDGTKSNEALQWGSLCTPELETLL